MVKRWCWFILLAAGLLSCAQLEETLRQHGPLIQNSVGKPSRDEVAQGLKQALTKGIERGASVLAEKGGYLENAAVKIPFPPEAKQVETALRRIGFTDVADQAVISMNRAAEDAAKSAIPVFRSAIASMTIQDAFDILFGEDDAATKYLRKTSGKEIEARFRPVIAQSLDAVGATRYWGDVIGKYNQIPLVKKINPDLPGYVTARAADGLFFQVAQEEKKIREAPVARTTELLKKVFSYYDRQH